MFYTLLHEIFATGSFREFRDFNKTRKLTDGHYDTVEV